MSILTHDASDIKDPSHDSIKSETRLTTYDWRAKVWDKHKYFATRVEQILLRAGTKQAQRWLERIQDCASWIWFERYINTSGEFRLGVKRAFFCKVRFCPVCQWRKSLAFKAKIYQNLPTVKKEYPTHRFLMLTLTMKNCPVEDLKKAIKKLNGAWQRLSQRKFFKSSITGWLKAIEVTRSRYKDEQGRDTAHPHIHVVLHVPASYFGEFYIKASQWREEWRNALRVDYSPSIWITAVKKGREDFMIREVLKYTVKESDMIEKQNERGEDDDLLWSFELFIQLHCARLITSSGTLKQVISQPDSFAEGIDLNAGEPATEPDEYIRFSYNRRAGFYAERDRIKAPAREKAGEGLALSGC